LRSLERALVSEAAVIIAEMHPKLAKQVHLLKPLTMSFFAMLNWHYLWHREDGPLTRQDYARLVATLIGKGAPAVMGAIALEDAPADAGG
jgi:hypothetical protein